MSEKPIKTVKKNSAPKTREERLAASLRENLKRRKAQSRLKKTEEPEETD